MSNRGSGGREAKKEFAGKSLSQPKKPTGAIEPPDKTTEEMLQLLQSDGDRLSFMGTPVTLTDADSTPVDINNTSWFNQRKQDDPKKDFIERPVTPTMPTQKTTEIFDETCVIGQIEELADLILSMGKNFKFTLTKHRLGVLFKVDETGAIVFNDKGKPIETELFYFTAERTNKHGVNTIFYRSVDYKIVRGDKKSLKTIMLLQWVKALMSARIESIEESKGSNK